MRLLNAFHAKNNSTEIYNVDSGYLISMNSAHRKRNGFSLELKTRLYIESYIYGHLSEVY